MADRLSAEIRIGGRIPAAAVPGLCGAIGDQNVGLAWGDCGFWPQTAADLLEACTDHGGRRWLCLYDDGLPWGAFATVENFLQRQGIAYDRFTLAKDAYPPTIFAFRTETGVLELETTADHDPVVPMKRLAGLETILQAAARQPKGNGSAHQVIEAALCALRKALPPRVEPLPALEVVDG